MAKHYEETFKKQIVALYNNGKWYFKASSINTRQKVDLIISNRDKYSINPMCKFLKIPRSLVYYHLKNRGNTEKRM